MEWGGLKIVEVIDRMKREIGSVECPRLQQEIPLEKCRACKFHLDVIRGHILCDFPWARALPLYLFMCRNIRTDERNDLKRSREGKPFVHGLLKYSFIVGDTFWLKNGTE